MAVAFFHHDQTRLRAGLLVLVFLSNLMSLIQVHTVDVAGWNRGCLQSVMMASCMGCKPFMGSSTVTSFTTTRTWLTTRMSLLITILTTITTTFIIDTTSTTKTTIITCGIELDLTIEIIIILPQQRARKVNQESEKVVNACCLSTMNLTGFHLRRRKDREQKV